MYGSPGGPNMGGAPGGAPPEGGPNQGGAGGRGDDVVDGEFKGA
jgi:hypothetical protein